MWILRRRGCEKIVCLKIFFGKCLTFGYVESLFILEGEMLTKLQKCGTILNCENMRMKGDKL